MEAFRAIVVRCIQFINDRAWNSTSSLHTVSSGSVPLWLKNALLFTISTSL